jgi:hypothetical protein
VELQRSQPSRLATDTSACRSGASPRRYQRNEATLLAIARLGHTAFSHLLRWLRQIPRMVAVEAEVTASLEMNMDQHRGLTAALRALDTRGPRALRHWEATGFRRFVSHNDPPWRLFDLLEGFGRCRTAMRLQRASTPFREAKSCVQTGPDGARMR